MNRLDQHISRVRSKMVFTRALWAIAWAGIAYAVIVWAAILTYKLVQVTVPHQFIVFEIVLAVALIAAVVYAIVTRPSLQTAAVTIDQRLALKEKFSTALYARNSNDPFARAAVRDAEKTAENVSLHKRFPIQWPRAFGGTFGMIVLALLTAWLLPTFDLLGVQQKRQAHAAVVEQSQTQARETIKKAIAEIAAAPKAVTDKPDIKLALADLQTMATKPDVDPTHAKNTAEKAMQDLQQAMKDRVKKNSDYAAAQQQVKEFAKLDAPSDPDGPIAKAQAAIAKNNLTEAVQEIDKAVKHFDQMTPKDQEKTARQMQQLANAINKIANDPKTQQQAQKKLEEMGANQQQAQQIMNQMQAAAAGDKAAQQAVQQAATQLAQQMNQQPGQTAQQQRANANAVQQAMNQIQQQTNTQASAQQLSQAAQALAQAMGQVAAASPQANQQSSQSNQPGNQQANNGQPKQPQAGGGAKQQQANAGQKGNQQGNQPGQPGQDQQRGNGKQGQQAGQGQQMADAAQNMQQKLQEMQAVANDAQQVASGQKNQNDQAGDGNQDGQGAGNQGQQGNGQGHQGGQQWAQNRGNGQQGQGGGVGKGGAQMPRPTVAPFQIKDETDLSEKNDKGITLASSFVKAGSIKGESKLKLHDALPVINKETPDEVDEQRIPRQDQDAVRGYFNNLEKETQK